MAWCHMAALTGPLHTLHTPLTHPHQPTVLACVCLCVYWGSLESPVIIAWPVIMGMFR